MQCVVAGMFWCFSLPLSEVGPALRPLPPRPPPAQGGSPGRVGALEEWVLVVCLTPQESPRAPEKENDAYLPTVAGMCCYYLRTIKDLFSSPPSAWIHAGICDSTSSMGALIPDFQGNSTQFPEGLSREMSSCHGLSFKDPLWLQPPSTLISLRNQRLSSPLPRPTFQITNKEQGMNRELSGDNSFLGEMFKSSPSAALNLENESWTAEKRDVSGSRDTFTSHSRRMPSSLLGTATGISHQPFVRREPGRRHSGRIHFCCYKAFQRRIRTFKWMSPSKADEQLLELPPLFQYLIGGYKYTLLFFRIFTGYFGKMTLVREDAFLYQWLPPPLFKLLSYLLGTLKCLQNGYF